MIHAPNVANRMTLTIHLDPRAGMNLGILKEELLKISHRRLRWDIEDNEVLHKVVLFANPALRTAKLRVLSVREVFLDDAILILMLFLGEVANKLGHVVWAGNVAGGAE